MNKKKFLSDAHYFHRVGTFYLVVFIISLIAYAIYFFGVVSTLEPLHIVLFIIGFVLFIAIGPAIAILFMSHSSLLEEFSKLSDNVEDIEDNEIKESFKAKYPIGTIVKLLVECNGSDGNKIPKDTLCKIEGHAYPLILLSLGNNSNVNTIVSEDDFEIVE